MSITGCTDPLIAIACTVVIQALRDLHSTRDRASAIGYLHSERCADLMVSCGADLGEWLKRREMFINGHCDLPRRLTVQSEHPSKKGQVSDERAAALRAHWETWERAHD